MTNKDLLYSTGTSTQYSIMTYMGIESKKRVQIHIYISITDSLCCIAEIDNIVNQLYSSKKLERKLKKEKGEFEDRHTRSGRRPCEDEGRD